MSFAEVVSLRETAREAAFHAKAGGYRLAILAFNGDYTYAGVDHAADHPGRVVAVVHPSGACNFVEAE